MKGCGNMSSMILMLCYYFALLISLNPFRVVRILYNNQIATPLSWTFANLYLASLDLFINYTFVMNFKFIPRPPPYILTVLALPDIFPFGKRLFIPLAFAAPSNDAQHTIVLSEPLRFLVLHSVSQNYCHSHKLWSISLDSRRTCQILDLLERIKAITLKRPQTRYY